MGTKITKAGIRTQTFVSLVTLVVKTSLTVLASAVGCNFPVRSNPKKQRPASGWGRNLGVAHLQVDRDGQGFRFVQFFDRVQHVLVTALEAHSP